MVYFDVSGGRSKQRGARGSGKPSFELLKICSRLGLGKNLCDQYMEKCLMMGGGY